MYAGSLYFKEATGLSIYVSSVCVLVITAVYVILGKFVLILKFVTRCNGLCHSKIDCNAVYIILLRVFLLSGGLQAVTYTDVLQCTIMLLGGIVLSALGKE
jgi:Na+/proline symporter